MKKFSIAIFSLVVGLSVLTPLSQVFAQKEYLVNVLFFYGRGCPHCAGMQDYLNTLKAEYPDLIVHEYETYFNQENRELFGRMAEAFDTQIHGVPTTFVDESILVGFSPNIAKELKNKIDLCREEGCIDPLKRLKTHEEAEILPEVAHIVENGYETMPESEQEELDEKENIQSKEDSGKEDKKNIMDQLTLPAVISAAVVDAINPCAFAVLIILITTVLATRRRKHALLSGLAFSMAIFISYYMMGIGLYSAIQVSGLTHIIYKVIAVLAIIIGLFNLKDYLWYGKWFVMEVPLSWRPRLRCLISGVTSVPGAFLIGFVVSVFLLPCTSGPYIVILGLLAKSATRNYAMILLALYNFIFVFPMILITGIVYFGLSNAEKLEGWRTKKLRTLHLIAGLIILGLGVGMITALWLGYV